MPILIVARAMPMVRTTNTIVLLAREHILDMGAAPGPPGISLGDPLRNKLPWLAPLVDMALEHARGQERLALPRPVGRDRPVARTGIAPADQIRQKSPVVGVGSTGTPGADQTVSIVDADKVLVAEHRDGKINWLRGIWVGALADLVFAVLDRPARIAALLSRLSLLPSFGEAPLLDRCLLRLGVALLGRRNHHCGSMTYPSTPCCRRTTTSRYNGFLS